MSSLSYSQTPIFYGGSGDGAVSFCYEQTDYLENALFLGGSDDGFTKDCQTQVSYSLVFNGGIGDGHTVNCYEEDVIPIFGVYTGGDGDGFAHFCHTQSAGIGNDLFMGGANDGFGINCFEQSPALGLNLFYGGSDDGFTVNCFTQENPLGSEIYNGGNGDGFAVYCFEQDLTPIAGIFAGGNSDGFGFFCFLQDDYLVELPIELVSFEASALPNERIIELTWETLSEINNDYFVVERSLDGINWEYVTKVDGAGNSSIAITYLTHDFTPHSKLSYYRLMQVDFDGQFTYSFVRSVVLNSDNMTTSNELLIYPNPATSLLNFQFDEFDKDELIIFIYDVSGKVVLGETIQLTNGQGLYTVTDLSMFNPGSYIVTITVGDEIKIQQKFVIN